MKHYFLTIIALFICTLTIQAQITIGINKQAVDGALLEITQGAETNKGLGLSRVQLSALDKLKMSGKEINDTDHGGGQYLAHTGLIVYNIKDPADVCNHIPSGLYVWGGKAWTPIGFKLTPDAPTNLLPMTTSVGLDQPNSYIVSKPGILRIPIEKAVSIWKNEYKGDFTTGSATVSNILTGANVQDISNMDLEAKLLWSSDQCGDLIQNANNLKMGGIGANRYIDVWVGDKKGNAVIALVKKGEDPHQKALWSWHVWSTDEPQTKKFDNDVEIYHSMDRNLGATSATVDDPATIGLHYQWGRKDPFPTPTTWSNTPGKVYGADEAEIDYGASKFKGQANTFASDEARFMKTINSPLYIISALAEPADWFSVNAAGQNNTATWADRWGANPATAKSPFDPCPEGWRVPRNSNGAGKQPNYPWNQGENAYLTFNTTNFPWTQHGREHADAGYFPAAGARSYSTGSVGDVGAQVYQATASPADISSATVGRMIFSQTHIGISNTSPTEGGSRRAIGYVVRCARNNPFIILPSSTKVDVGESVTLTVVTNPADLSCIITWDGAIVAVTGDKTATFTPTQKGTYKIEVTCRTLEGTYTTAIHIVCGASVGPIG